MRKLWCIAFLVICSLLTCFAVSAAEYTQPSEITKALNLQGVLIEIETKTIGRWDIETKTIGECDIALKWFSVEAVIMHIPDRPPLKGIHLMTIAHGYIDFDEIPLLKNAMDRFIDLTEQANLNQVTKFKEFIYRTKSGILFYLTVGDTPFFDIGVGGINLIRFTQLSDIKALKGYIDDAYEYLVNYKE